MSENKEPEIREQNNGSEHEPIESIEQTVADLKKKIEELTGYCVYDLDDVLTLRLAYLFYSMLDP